MTEHSIAELHRQVRESYGRMTDAQRSHMDAQRRLHTALVAKSGLLGKRLRGKKKDIEILVHDVEFMSGEAWAVRGFQFKQDGTLGERERRLYLDDIEERAALSAISKAEGRS